MKITLVQLLIIAGVLLVASLFLKPISSYETFVDAPAPAALPDFMAASRLTVPLTDAEKVKLLEFYEAYTAAAFKDAYVEIRKRTTVNVGDQEEVFGNTLGGMFGLTPAIFQRSLPQLNSLVSGYFGKPWKEAFAAPGFKAIVRSNVEWYVANPLAMPIERVRKPISNETKFLEKYTEVMARLQGTEMNDLIQNPSATPAAPAASATPAAPAASSTTATPATPAATATPAAPAASSTTATPATPAAPAATATPATPTISENATPAEKLRQLKSLLKCANMAEVAEPEATYKLVSNFLKCQSA